MNDSKKDENFDTDEEILESSEDLGDKDDDPDPTPDQDVPDDTGDDDAVNKGLGKAS